MTALAIGGSYGLIGFLTACRVAALLSWFWMRRENATYPSLRGRVVEPTAGDWFLGMMTGLIAGLVWPATLIAALLRGFLFAPPQSIQNARQAARIAELERELELQS